MSLKVYVFSIIWFVFCAAQAQTQTFNEQSLDSTQTRNSSSQKIDSQLKTKNKKKIVNSKTKSKSLKSTTAKTNLKNPIKKTASSSVSPSPQTNMQNTSSVNKVAPVTNKAPINSNTSTTVPKEESIERTLLRKNIQISNWLDRLADRIDLMLVGKRVSKTKNDTNLKIQNSTFSTEGKKVTNAFSVSLNPRFPNLEEYLQLKFTSTDDRTEERQVVSNSLNERQRDKDYSSPVGLGSGFGKVKASFQPTVQVRDRVTLSHSLNFDWMIEGQKNAVNPKLELFVNADKGVGVYNALNFHFQVSKEFVFTLINEGEYLERANLYTVNNGPAFNQYYSDRVTLGYSLIFTSTNRPKYHLESYNLAFSYGLHIYKKILDIQAIPQIDFQKTRRFKGAAGFTFNVNLRF